VGTLAVREHILNPEYRTKFAGFFIWDLLASPKETKASMHWSTDVATPEQVNEYEQLLEEGLQQGSVGVGHAVGYMVAGCSQEESIIVQKMAGKYGQSTFIHARFSGQMPPTSQYKTPARFTDGTIQAVAVATSKESYENLELEAKRILLKH
jgi:hypothetical protein